ncbi:hypothetical protein CC78DRAFT_574596 [Lojkania enalia]|uniref:Uncharacterized protein n=1 Tax=Lojkania enalia TaxID=147567 RepID=A0A9P4NAS5_9PLEO|nr:hypothetical protein CC78DRAFT_574596 [Didymosphaeria enalia]
MPPGSGPTTPSRNATVMDCSSDPRTFVIVQIHTAKCAICDARNMATMRRCTGCTYQICQPCFENRNGKPLIHGNLIGGPVNLPSTPSRKKLYTPGSNLDAVSATAASASRTGVTMGAASTPVGSSSSQQNTPVYKASPAGAAEPQQQTPAKSTPGSIERGRDKKGKVVISSDSDDEFVPEMWNPTSATVKRRKMLEQPKGMEHAGISGERPLLGKRSSRSTAGQQTTVQSLPNMLPHWRRPKASDRNLTPMPTGDSESHAGALLPDHPGVYSHDVNGPKNCSMSDCTAAELIERLREQVGLPPYQEHLLGRREPVLTNPVIHIPPNVKRNFKPLPRASEIQQDIQDGAREKLETRWVANVGLEYGVGPGTAAAKGPELDIGVTNSDPQTLRQFVEIEAGKLMQGMDIDNDQQQIVRLTLNETARVLAKEFQKDAPEVVRNVIKFGLTMPMRDLGGAQQEQIVNTIHDVGTRQLAAFKDDTINDSKRKSSPSLPQAAMFQVSPVRPSFHLENRKLLSPRPSALKLCSPLTIYTVDGSDRVKFNQGQEKADSMGPKVEDKEGSFSSIETP